MTRRIRLVVEYDGTDFVGWQRQSNGPSVQAALEEAVARMTGVATAVQGAGRTDSGVHAIGQVAAFTTEANIPALGFQRGLNRHLPPSVAVVAADEVPLAFDPRRHARGKLYRYRIWNAEARSPMEACFAWHLRRSLDAEAMHAAARPLLGSHDFSAFRAADCGSPSTVRILRRLDVTRAEHLVTIEIEATAFLRNMVRILVGTLVDAGHGGVTADDVQRILAGRDRDLAGITALPHGLSLVRVDYDLGLPRRR